MRRVGVRVRIHTHGRFLLEVQEPEVQVLVGVSDFLGVGRPRRRIIKSRWIAEIDLADFAEAALVADMQRVFPGLVG